MKKIIEADQELPYKLIKSKFLHREQYKDLLYIVNKNIPNINASEIIEMFKKISDSGCTCAMIANVLVNQLYGDDNEFQNAFGFSLLTNKSDKIDCNKLMVDIFSRLYKIIKVIFIEYDHYSFNSVNEAALTLLGEKYNTDSEALLALFNNGILANGVDANGKFLFKGSKPKITNYVGTCQEIAKEKFGVVGIQSLEELKKIATDRKVILEYKYLEIHEKFSGLGQENFNFWINYYLQTYNTDFLLDKKAIVVSEFNGDYNEFMDYINQLVLNGYSISVSARANDNTYMHTKKPMSWGKISSEKSGHVMLFKYFNKSNDIVVSSYGKDYIIPKEYFVILEFNSIKKIKKVRQDEYEEPKRS